MGYEQKSVGMCDYGYCDENDDGVFGALAPRRAIAPFRVPSFHRGVIPSPTTGVGTVYFTFIDGLTGRSSNSRDIGVHMLALVGGRWVPANTIRAGLQYEFSAFDLYLNGNLIAGVPVGKYRFIPWRRCRGVIRETGSAFGQSIVVGNNRVRIVAGRC